MTVHNHGPEEGRGLSCPEAQVRGLLRGACLTCHHCGEAISDALPGPSHVTGRNSYLSRCWSLAPGEYGSTAHAAGTPCPGHCGAAA